MYNVRIRDEQALADVEVNGQGITARLQRGRVARTHVRRFGSLVEAQEMAKLLKSVLRLG